MKLSRASLAIAGSLSATIAVSGCLNFGAQPAVPPSPSPVVNLSCSVYDDALGDGALGDGPTPELTVTTGDDGTTAPFDVTVYDFGPDGAQAGSTTFSITESIAPDQTLTFHPESTDGDTATCSVASVASSIPLAYTTS